MRRELCCLAFFATNQIHRAFSISMQRGEAQVTTNHAFTGRMCAASRYEETRRPDSLFVDELGALLAGKEGLDQPMGAWILVPRTRRGDDFLVERYKNFGARQLVLLGAGMDARAFRSFPVSGSSSPAKVITLPELKVFEIDQQTTFDVKEPLLWDKNLTVASRTTVGYDFAKDGRDGWAQALVSHGFNPKIPTVWLLEGLLYYLSDDDVKAVMASIGNLSAPKSAVFHDAVTASYVRAGIAPGGAPFISGSDNYAALWRTHAGFDVSFVRNFGSVRVDRRGRRLTIDDNPARAEATPSLCRGRDIVLFVEAEKTV